MNNKDNQQNAWNRSTQGYQSEEWAKFRPWYEAHADPASELLDDNQEDE